MIKIIEGDFDSFIKKSSEEMDKALKFFEKDILSLRTGKASSSLVDGLPVESYGQFSKVREIASVSTPDARTIVISPWDKSLIPNIQKAISTSDVGLTPNVDGEIIRLVLPMMSSERRDEIAKQLNKKLEESKVNVRNVRRDFHSAIKASEKDKNISQDFAKILEEKLQKNTDAWIEKLVAVAKKKEADLRAI